MPTYSTFQTWLDAPVTTKIYLVTVTLRYVSGGAVLTEKLYLSNHAYNTTASESPASTEFLTVLQDEDIPSFDLNLSSFFFGIGAPAFGALVVGNADGEMDAKLPPTREWEGGEIEVKLTGARDELALANAKVVLKGVIGKILESTENTIKWEIFSRFKELERKRFPTTTFTAPNGELTLEPVLYGYAQNIEPILKDAVTTTNIIYKVTGHALTDITDVYDNGVALTLTTQWVKDLANGEFALKQQPVGKITCNAKGKSTKYPGDYSEQRFDFIADALETYGGVKSADFDYPSFSAGNADVSGPTWIYVKEETSVLEFVTTLLTPVLGWLYFDREGKAFTGILKTSSGTPALTLTANELLPLSGADASADITRTSSAELLLFRSSLGYDQNGTVQSEDSIGASGAVDPSTRAGRERREWLKSEWRFTEKELTGAAQGRSLYPTAGEQQVPSYFRNKADADAFSQTWLDFFGVSRRVINCKANVQPLQRNPHDVIRITDGRFFSSLDTRLISYKENYGENVVEMQLLVI